MSWGEVELQDEVHDWYAKTLKKTNRHEPASISIGLQNMDPFWTNPSPDNSTGLFVNSDSRSPAATMRITYWIAPADESCY